MKEQTAKANNDGTQQIVVYKPSERIRMEVKTDGETVWLTQEQMCQLFGRERSVITKHVRNVFRDGELVPEAVCAKFAHTAPDGKVYQVVFYNLDVVISVGYRVQSRVSVFVSGRRECCGNSCSGGLTRSSASANWSGESILLNTT